MKRIVNRGAGRTHAATIAPEPASRRCGMKVRNGHLILQG